MGQAVELAACECASRPWAGDAVGVVAEVGARCRCGCVLHLAPAARLLAGSARACAARSFWLLQAEEGLVVRLRFESVRLPCPGQALRARDGDSLASPLLASWDGPDGNAITGEATRLEGGAVELAGGRHILVELRSADTSDACAGGFLAHAMQMGKRERERKREIERDTSWWSCGPPTPATPAPAASSLTPCRWVRERERERERLRETHPGGAAVRRHQRRLCRRLPRSRHADGDACAGGFLAHAMQMGKREGERERERETSSHAMQMEPIRNASEAWASVSASSWWVEGGGARAAALALAGGAALAAVALALHSAHRTRAYQRAADKESLTDSDACSLSLELGGATAGSRSTLLSEVAGGAGGRGGRAAAAAACAPAHAAEGRGGRGRRAEAKYKYLPISGTRDAEDEEATSELDNEDEDCTSAGSHNSGASQATVTPERVSASSAPAGQQATPSPLRRSHTISTASVVIEQVRSPPQSSIKSESQSTTADLSTSISSVSEREGDSCSEKDRDSLWEKERCQSRASSSTSAATLTNGWYSPALSGVAAARVRGNPKHSKESSNRRLLRSDLSLTSHPEMEIDYYDYEVNNAGSAPGSYLGMDPAFLVWIPPIEDGDIIREIDETQVPIYEEIVPKELHPDPGSNTESPEERPSSSTLKRNLDNRSEKSNGSVKSTRKVVDRTNIIHPLNFSITDLQHSPKLRRNKKKKDNDIPMKDLTLTRSPVKIHTKRDRSEVDNNATLKRVNDNARETRDDTLKRTSDLSDIKFADDSESSNDIKFADDDTPDSNKMIDKFDVRV
ncbi:unnamed protein product [Plutella xylostella]|uniref:(diamondback moth) hypothetical protein n=1 Tax=Plutella xylostella TaxID=51655 RepID=A0A8S4G705_PLUXY|nr:unnamed protein product [Plutella xylostella]